MFVVIGTRQLGRLRASSVVDCAVDQATIARELGKMLDTGVDGYDYSDHPYGYGNAARKTVETLARLFAEGRIVPGKQFHDLHV